MDAGLPDQHRKPFIPVIVLYCHAKVKPFFGFHSLYKSMSPQLLAYFPKSAFQPVNQQLCISLRQQPKRLLVEHANIFYILQLNLICMTFSDLNMDLRIFQIKDQIVIFPYAIRNQS